MGDKNYVQFYKDEKYDMCYNLFKDLDFRNVPECVLSGEKHKDDTIKECFYRNNNLICLALMLGNKTLNCRESWSDIMHQFIQLHVAYKGLPVIPLSLRMNYVFNALWWYWTKPFSFNCEDIHFQRLMDISFQLLVLVLNRFKESYSTHFKDITMADIINLIKMTSNYILKLNCLESLQLVDMYIVLLEIIIKRCDNDLVIECLTFFERLYQRIEVLRLHLASNNDMYSTQDSPLFKFGLEYVNSIATTYKYEASLVTLLISGSLASVNKEKYDDALSYLKIAEKIGNIHSFNYILNYLKAYCHLYLEEDNETELLLATISSEAVGMRHKSYYYQLLGSLYSQRAQHKDAISHFEKAVETGYNVSAALLLAANEAEQLGLPSLRCIFLKNLVDTLKTENGSKVTSIFQLRSFPERCFSALHPDPVVTLSEALYLLAKEALMSQHYVTSVEHFSELITTLKNDVTTEVSEERPAPLPKVSVIHHEAALANLKAHSLAEALGLCQSVISHHIPRSTVFKEVIGNKRKRQAETAEHAQDVESVLAVMDEDVVALILASDILSAQMEIQQAVDNLDRCSNVILEYKKYNIPEKKPRSEIFEQQSNADLLCNCLMAKILLRKAKMNETRNFSDSVYHYYRRALQHSPGDEEVLYNFKMWLQQNKIDEPFEFAEKKEVISLEGIQNCALKYILEPNVEIQNAVVVEDYAIDEDIVDSLFDDY